MVLDKLPLPPGRPTNLDIKGQEPTVLAVGAGRWWLFGHFSHLSIFSLFLI